MVPYHEVFWLALVIASALIAVCYVLLAGLSLRRQPALQKSMAVSVAAFGVVALAAIFATGMTCLALRRDFMRPALAAIVVTVGLVGTVGLLAAIARDAARRDPE